MGSGPSLLCQPFFLPAPHSRTQSEFFITGSHRGWCQISSLDMEITTALENKLLFIAVRRRTQSLKKEKLACFGSSLFLNVLTFLRKGSQVSSFCILAGIPQVGLPRSAFSSTAPLLLQYLSVFQAITAPSASFSMLILFFY